METILAVITGTFFAAGIYLILRRSIVKLVLGLIFLGHAANLLIFTASGLTRGAPPIVAEGATALAAPHGDPLPQALILTAIVISFGVFAFSLVLIKRAYRMVGSDDLDQMIGTDR